MLRTRVIPALLLRHESLVKTVKFGKLTYIGDPCNTVRIFNELEVDELLLLDILASREGQRPNLKILRDIANECFMPLGYGGGIRSLDDAKAIFDIGFEKISLNTQAVLNPNLVTEIAEHYGSQAVIASIDVKRGFLGREQVRRGDGGGRAPLAPVAWAQELECRGAGEILLTSVEREGTWDGFETDLIRRVSDAVSVPVIAHGGCGTVDHIGEAVKTGGASAVALGSMVVLQKKGMGVLVNFPDREELKKVLER